LNLLPSNYYIKEEKDQYICGDAGVVPDWLVTTDLDADKV